MLGAGDSAVAVDSLVNPSRRFSLAGLNIAKPLWHWLITQPPRTLLNLGLIAVLTAVVLTGGINQRRASAASYQSLTTPASSNTANSSAARLAEVDRTATVYIAANVATQLDLPVAAEVIARAQALNTSPLSATISSETETSKPQVVATEGARRREILSYVTAEGDTLAKIAKRFNVSPDTLTWANNLSAGELLPNTQLKIPPLNGVLYTVQADDSVASLAKRYQAKAEEITAYNDVDVYGLQTGRQIIIPHGVKPEPQQNFVQPAYSFKPVFSGNGYDWGWCTWWAAERRRQIGKAIPSNWSDAAYWADGARASGYQVGTIPRVGAIAQENYSAGGLGHVAIVEAVSKDGRKVKISDMNGYTARWGQIPSPGSWAWMPSSTFQHYIY